APGPISPAQSTVTANPTTIATNQTSTVTLTAEDANGTPLTSGGAAVGFTLGTGATATGDFTTATDNGDGTYTATFTPTRAGSAPVAATIGGQPVTSTLATITATSGPTRGTADPAQSTVTASPTTIATNQT